MVRVRPCLRHLDGAVVGRVRIAAHAADDPLRERDPDLLVVVELRMTLERRDRGLARLLVARGVEYEPMPLAEPPIALGTELRSRPREREVDVEEDGLQ